jgi:hypothetical protein
VLVEPFFQGVRLGGREDDDLVFADDELRLDLDPASTAAARDRRAAGLGRAAGSTTLAALLPDQTRVGLLVLDEARRGELLEVVKISGESVFTCSCFSTTGTGTTMAKSSSGPL